MCFSLKLTLASVEFQTKTLVFKSQSLSKIFVSRIQLLLQPLFAVWASWWRHKMETFSALLALCAGNSPVPGEFPAQRPVTRVVDVFFNLRLDKQLSKQSWGWWFETLSRPLWRHSNELELNHRPTINGLQWYMKCKDKHVSLKTCRGKLSTS